MAGRPRKQKSITSIFALRLTERMLKMDVGNEELCSKIGVKASQTISGYKSGTREPDIDKLIKIADALNTSVDYLIGRTDDPDPDPDMVKISEMTGLSSDAIRVLHFWTTQKRVHAINEKHSYEEGTLFRESKDWVNLLSLLICTDAGGPISNKYDLLLLSSIYEYVTFQPDDNFTLFKANKSEEGYSPEVMGVFKSDDLYMADKHGMRPITTELMKEAMRKYINDNLDKLAEIIQDAKIQRSYPLSSVSNIDE